MNFADRKGVTKISLPLLNFDDLVRINPNFRFDTVRSNLLQMNRPSFEQAQLREGT